MVPDGWHRVAIGDICKVVTGSTPSTANEANFGGDIPFVTPSDLGDRKVIDQAERTLSADGAKASRVINAGSTLFVCIGSTIGKVGIAGRDLVTNQQINSVLPSTGTSPEFVYYQLAMRSKAIAQRAGTHAVPLINKSQFSDEPIDLPPLPEQKKIADILSTWDKAIETTRKLLTNAERQKRALMQQLLTGKRWLKGFEGSEWRTAVLADLANIKMGSSPPSSAYNDIGLGMPLLQGNADIRAGFSAPRSYTTEITQTCRSGDSLLSVRAPVGSIARSTHEACVGRGLAVLRAKSSHEQEWLHHLLVWLEPRWARLSQGSTFEAINRSDIRSLEIDVPVESEERIAIGRVLADQSRVVAAVECDIKTLRTEKRALMQQLLTGKRRVTV